jgi:hypothetical protein
MKLFSSTLLIFFVSAFAFSQEHGNEPSDASPKDWVEVRAGFTKEGISYKYFDYSHSFKNKVIVDVAYFGTKESNELFVGAGRYYEKNHNYAAILGYAVIGRHRQLGFGAAIFAETKVSNAKIKIESFGFLPIKGVVPKYLSIDTADVTFDVGKRFEIGGATSILLIKVDSFIAAGPVFRIKDNLGATSFYVLVGKHTEFRISRSFSFDLFKSK